MATEAQINANRQNAQYSTGARTDAGKAASSRNHLTLGLYTRQDYVKPEERDLYKEFCETMYHELTPASLLEEAFVAEITGATWRLRRCSNAEGELADYATLDPLLDESTDKTRRSIERARAGAHSLLHRSINQLRKLQTERAKRGAAPPQPVHPDQTLADIMSCPEPDWDAIDRDIAAEKAALASNCKPATDPSSSAFIPANSASNCSPTPTPPLIAQLIARNLPCACKSGKILRECCGKEDPPVLQKAA